jgi:hypothetical protein
MKHLDSRFIPTRFAAFVDKSINCLFNCANLAVKILDVVHAGNSFSE